MRSLRYEIELKGGVKVGMLFTPHLYSFRGFQGIDFEIEGERSERKVCEMYADIMVCAALNAWVLDGKGNVEDFPFTRGDFHEFMMMDPKTFGKALSFALEALTGKSLRDYVQEAAKGKETGKKEERESKKKVLSHLTGWLARLFSSESAE